MPRKRKVAGFEDDHSMAIELYSFAENTSELYGQKQSIEKNLINKMAKGVYDSERAVQAFLYWMDSAAKMYAQEGSGSQQGWHEMFSKSVRQEAAQLAVESFEAEADLGNYDSMLHKKYQKQGDTEINASDFLRKAQEEMERRSDSWGTLLRDNQKSDANSFQQLDSLDLETLAQLIDMEVESMLQESGGDWETVDASDVPDFVIKEAAKFEAAVEAALDEWVAQNPDAIVDEFEADSGYALYEEEGPYNVLMTLNGHGVGIWDGRWDHFFVNPKEDIEDLQKFLDEKLGGYAEGTGTGSLNDAISEAAYKLYGDDYATEYEGSPNIIEEEDDPILDH